MIASKCTHILASDGSELQFELSDVEHLLKSTIEPMASEGLRTLGIAFRDFENEPNWAEESKILSNLTLIMIAGMSCKTKGMSRILGTTECKKLMGMLVYFNLK